MEGKDNWCFENKASNTSFIVLVVGNWIISWAFIAKHFSGVLAESHTLLPLAMPRHPKMVPATLRYFKLNLDASTMGNLRMAGVGEVICASNEVVVISFPGPLGIRWVNEAEALALLIGFPEAIVFKLSSLCGRRFCLPRAKVYREHL